MADFCHLVNVTPILSLSLYHSRLDEDSGNTAADQYPGRNEQEGQKLLTWPDAETRRETRFHRSVALVSAVSARPTVDK